MFNYSHKVFQSERSLKRIRRTETRIHSFFMRMLFLRPRLNILILFFLPILG